MPPKSETDHIYLLLSILEHTEGKTNWNEIAKVTGLYKDGKFVRQALNSIKSKYGDSVPKAGNSNGNAPTTTTTPVPTPKSTSKKRGKVNDDDVSPSKKSKTKATDKTNDDGFDSDLKGEDEEG